MRTIRFLLEKEYRQIFRDRAMMFQMLMIPMIQLLVLANAATFEVKRANLYVVDHDHTESSRGLVTRLVASGRFVLTGASASPALADRALLARDANVIVALPAEFERDLVRLHAAPVQLVLNAEDGAAAGVTLSYARQIIVDYAADRAATLTPSARTVGLGAEEVPVAGVPRIEVQRRGWYNPDLNYKTYMVPGILVELVTIVGTLLTAVNIAREKELGTLDQLNVTPVTRGQFIAGKLIPLWSIVLVELSIGLVVARLVFDVPMRGSIPLIFAIAAVYLFAALGIGLWISTMVQTQQQAIFISFFVMMIYLLMSGLFTPVRSMPQWAQWIAHVNPVMYFAAIMRQVLLKGAELRDVLVPALVLVGYGAVVFTLAVRQYTKRTV